MTIEQKIHEELSTLAHSLGNSDANLSLYDNFEAMHDKTTEMALAKVLLRLIDLDNFENYVQKYAIEQYINGYVSGVESSEDLPRDINKGNVCGISITLTKEQQEKIRSSIPE